MKQVLSDSVTELQKTSVVRKGMLLQLAKLPRRRLTLPRASSQELGVTFIVRGRRDDAGQACPAAPNRILRSLW